MDFALTEEQLMLQESIGGYLRSACPLDAVRKATEAGTTHVPEIADELAQLGAGGILIPEELGGVGMGFVEAALISEALGSVIAPVAFVASSVMAPVALLGAGSQDQKETWLPRVANGEVIIGVGISEHIGRRETDGIFTDDNTLTGKAMFVLDGMDADMLLVADNDAQLYLVQASDVTRNKLKTIDRTRSVAEIILDQTPAEILPGSVNNRKHLNDMVNAGRVMLAADTLGAAGTMLEQAIEYAKERRQFNRVIGSFQAVKHMCSEMAADLEPCRSLVWYAAHAIRAIPDEATLMACHAKAHLAETGRFVARKATEVHGGMGFTDLLGLHYWFKRIGFDRQLLGAPEVVREEAAVAQGWI